MPNFIKIHEQDNVIVALSPLTAGTRLEIEDGVFVILQNDIPAGHKIAIRNIPEGGKVIKYGSPIGNALTSISAGDWVHTHNLKTALDSILEYKYQPTPVSKAQRECASFQGFVRSDGSVGVRNEIWIIPTVGCVNDVAKAIARRTADCVHGSVDEVVAFSHPYGCSQLGGDQENTRRILADLIRHPNAGGVLVLGLGCENSGIEVLKSYVGAYDARRVQFMSAQDYEDEIEEASRLVRELIDNAAQFERQAVSADRLVVGLKCGGSDGLSGITANPLVGRFSDLLISMGGTALLTEVPEMFGAETLLMNRCADEELFHKTVDLINDFKSYFQRHGQVIYENPSPGNKAGGISTLEDKSLGCVQKSGSTAVRGVLEYGDRVTAHGLNLLSAPGNDLVSSTALAAAGAHIVLFTTGRGTPFACPVPTMKISTNSALARRKANWIDYNAGRLVEGTTMEEASWELFRLVLKIASGQKVCSETSGFHDMAIFKQGVTL